MIRHKLVDMKVDLSVDRASTVEVDDLSTQVHCRDVRRWPPQCRGGFAPYMASNLASSASATASSLSGSIAITAAVNFLFADTKWTMWGVSPCMP